MSTKNISTEPLVVERTFDAPVALVWRAITIKEDMNRWYFDLKEFRPEAGFEFQFVVEHEGNRYDHRCKVTEVVPQKKIAYTWRYEGHEGDSLVTFELFAEGNKTKLKLTHESLETFPKTPAFARKNFVQGWTMLIGTSLKDYAEHADREIFITREFNAPRDLVWEAMTNPKHVVNWWGPRGFSTTIEEMDFRIGGVWKHVMRGPDGVKYPNQSVFKEIVKPERIVYTHGGKRENGPGISFESTWSFEALAADKTRVTIRMVFPSAEKRNFVVKEFGAVEGGKQTLERLGEHLAKAGVRPFSITRKFNAPRELVWKAWTEREHLMKWFGPKGFTMRTAKMDFRPGGIFHYCLCAPDGKEMWGKFNFREIVAPDKIILVNSFSDENGGLTRHPFSATWPLEMLSTTTFAERDGKTILTIEWVPLNPTDEERRTFDAMRDGMTQGWTGTFEQLDEYLAKETKQ
jgi:uncharacterized protein YndB with AHSA1/START domain